ncbi:MAG: hypothetical protein Q9163_004612 [Psora crenata]
MVPHATLESAVHKFTNPSIQLPPTDAPLSTPLLHLPQSSSSKDASFQVRSPTLSSLADDEASLISSSAVHDMESSQDVEIPGDLPRYPGDDTRPTSKKEISAWYSYGFAAEVFVVCGIGSFIPIALEQLSRERGFLLSDKSKPCTGSSLDVPLRTDSNADATATADRPPRPETGQCIITFFGAEINTASFAMYTFSVSVLVQALLIISMSAAADHGRSRKSLLLYFAFIGAVATMLFLAVVPRIYVFAALLAIIANTCCGASFVLLNSFLPILVRRHPSMLSLSHEDASNFLDRSGPSYHTNHTRPSDETHPIEATHSLLPSTRTQQKLLEGTPKESASPALQLSTQISSYGIGIGYLAAVTVQTLGIIMVIVIQPLTSSTTLTLRLVLFFVGLWWLLFTIPAALWLRPRPGPPLPYTGEGKQKWTWVGHISYAWKSLWKTVLKARHLRDVVFFLGVWFLLSDSIATVSGTAVLFAKTDLQMKPAALALINLIGTLAGVVGAFTWSKLSRWFKLKPSQTIIVCICLFEVIPLYGLLGFLPAIKRLGVFGLQQPWEMYPLGAIYGFVLGGLSSYCRSLFGELIPPGFETAFYALYAITDKGSSVFGPAIVGAITDRYGEIRPAFVFLAVVIFIPLPLMLLVDVERGKMEGAQMADLLDGRKDKKTSPASDDGTIQMIDEEEEERYPHYNVTPEHLFDLFGKFGPIRLGIANNTKGTAFVVYEDVMDAKQACDKLNGFNFQNRYLVVEEHLLMIYPDHAASSTILMSTSLGQSTATLRSATTSHLATPALSQINMLAAVTSASAGNSTSSGTSRAGAENGECKLLGPFALLVQGALGLLALLSLVFKRWRERPQRPVKIWAFDASKQVVGSALLHMANLFMSMLSSGELTPKADDFQANPCSFYLLNLAIDASCIPILIVLLRLLSHGFLLTPFGHPPESIMSGNYGRPPKAKWWLKQCFIYFLGLLGMKLCVYFIFQICPWIIQIGDWALRWTEGNEMVQVFFVMLFFPLVMNALQYYIIDGFIKDQKPPDHEPIPDGDVSEGSEDDDDETRQRDPSHMGNDSIFDSVDEAEAIKDDAVGRRSENRKLPSSSDLPHMVKENSTGISEYNPATDGDASVVSRSGTPNDMQGIQEERR